jgi:hypothetical protein
MSDIKIKSMEDTLELVEIIGTVMKGLIEQCSDPNHPERMELYSQFKALSDYQHTIIKGTIYANTGKFKKYAASLKTINDELQKTFDDLTKIAETLKNLVEFVKVVEKIASLFSSVTIVPTASHFAAAMKAKSVHFIAGSDEIPPEFFAGEEITVPVSLLPIEEVLYGVELTPEKLIITVATGGCTGEDSFHVEVNKGYTGLPPYFVTVYRIVPDDCKGAFEPIKIAFSREKLGLDGLIEFVFRNKIGNTSQHRLNS